MIFLCPSHIWVLLLVPGHGSDWCACPALPCLPCRDLSDPSGAERSSSIACCGHEARTRITRIAFHPAGGDSGDGAAADGDAASGSGGDAGAAAALLATASDSGTVALFDWQQFRRGGVLAPLAFTRLHQSAGEGRLAGRAGCLFALQLARYLVAGRVFFG